MNRKRFLSSMLAGGTLLPGIPAAASYSYPDYTKKPIIPPYLKPGDTIGITCPAGYITLKEIEPAMEQMKSWGYTIKVGSTVGKRDFTFGGSDAERAEDFQQMINDPGVKAIMCARGGYGFVRIVDRLDFSRLVTKPKWIIGFSDITVLHGHLNRNYGIASIHSKMCNSFPEDWTKADPIQMDTILSIRKALSGETMKYTTTPTAFNKLGTVSGVLVGGNLKTIETLAGSKSDLNTAGKILFVEDTGEYLYSIDRMFWNLARTGKLEDLKGLIVGGFKVKPDDPGEEFGRTVQDIVLEKVSRYDFPVCFDFPVGHQKNNFALKCGVVHQLTVDATSVSLVEK
ncbi:LD-carboxypeptidase [Paraflavitalea sp. CAU 1676]|uniref:S66 peptidase family protein n=1 Tax=Paraflavitalea sp. CAU 1676 TaxID=3032598 RepID=UPI0023DBDADE|nr:LD-carboxypeptidase [Paraflavitalea sp. CAU 1676]MDF2187655.1 LD-carboxypeptidase [Paraflavitalea sp. CAU 1676]